MRTSAAIATTAAIVAGLALGGCSVFRSDDEVETKEEQLAAAAAQYSPIEAVSDIELGRTRDGFVITARGIAPGVGYSAPELRPRRQGKPGPDGFIDYDFVAQAPDPSLNLGVGEAKLRVIRADLLVATNDLRGTAGVRVHGLSGGLQLAY